MNESERYQKLALRLANQVTQLTVDTAMMSLTIEELQAKVRELENGNASGSDASETESSEGSNGQAAGVQGQPEQVGAVKPG